LAANGHSNDKFVWVRVESPTIKCGRSKNARDFNSVFPGEWINQLPRTPSQLRWSHQLYHLIGCCL